MVLFSVEVTGAVELANMVLFGDSPATLGSDGVTLSFTSLDPGLYAFDRSSREHNVANMISAQKDGIDVIFCYQNYFSDHHEYLHLKT